MANYFHARLTGLSKKIYIYIALIPASYMRTSGGFFTPSRLWTEILSKTSRWAAGKTTADRKRIYP